MRVQPVGLRNTGANERASAHVGHNRWPSTMNAAPLISVALCTYNGERYLAAQLTTLLTQSWPNLEIVVMDDHSSDGTWAILESFAAQDGRLRIERNSHNLGIVANFAKALSACRGAYIAPCDQDDLWLPHKLTRLHGIIQDKSLAYCDSELIDADGRPVGMKVSDRLNMVSGQSSVSFAFWNCVSGHAMLFTRELLDQAQPMPMLRYHDWWLAFVAASRGGIAYLNEALVQYRQHQDAQTNIARAGGRPNEAPRGAVAVYTDRARWLSQLASLPGPDQGYLVELSRLWQRREREWFSPALVQHLASRKAEVMAINRRASFAGFALKQFWGLRTKQLLEPQARRQ